MDSNRGRGRLSRQPGRSPRRTGKEPASSSEPKSFGNKPKDQGYVRMIDLMQQKLKEAEGLKKKDPIQKFCRFGRSQLPILQKGDPRAFRPLEGLPVDLQQKCLLDAIWCAMDSKNKLEACCALQYYFNRIMSPPQGKNFSYYALCSGPHKGIYCYYSSLCHAIGEETARPIFKGFYSFNEALNYLWDTVDDKQEEIFIEDEPRNGPFIESLQIEIRDLLEKVDDLTLQIHLLKDDGSAINYEDDADDDLDPEPMEADEGRRTSASP